MHSQQRRLEPGTFARMKQSCSEVAGQSIMFRPRVTMLLAATLMGSSISNVSNNTARHTPPTQRNTTKSKLKYEPSFSFFITQRYPQTLTVYFGSAVKIGRRLRILSLPFGNWHVSCALHHAFRPPPLLKPLTTFVLLSVRTCVCTPCACLLRCAGCWR